MGHVAAVLVGEGSECVVVIVHAAAVPAPVSFVLIVAIFGASNILVDPFCAKSMFLLSVCVVSLLFYSCAVFVMIVSGCLLILIAS